jgi:hypothetical protein
LIIAVAAFMRLLIGSRLRVLIPRRPEAPYRVLFAVCSGAMGKVEMVGWRTWDA